jgi:3'-phosphoadenosine 5'-phosphosulfate sulfotransferase (PAPS reductase)/FAD synthetase
MSYDLTYLSFGAGVQSTALLGLCLTGAPGFPRPDLVIHADTQSDMRATERHVEWAKGFCAEHGVEMVVSTAGRGQAAS